MLDSKLTEAANVKISTSVLPVAQRNISADKMLTAKTPVDHTHAHASLVSHSTPMVRHAKISMNALKKPIIATRMLIAPTPAVVSHANANLDFLVMELTATILITAKTTTAVLEVLASRKIIRQHVSVILVSNSKTENVSISMNATKKLTTATRMRLVPIPSVVSPVNVSLDSPVMVSTVMILTTAKIMTAVLEVLASRKIMPPHASVTLVSNSRTENVSISTNVKRKPITVTRMLIAPILSVVLHVNVNLDSLVME